MGGLTTRQLARKQTRFRKNNHREQLQPGKMLQDRYRIVGTLGMGGFSSVYQARDMHFPTVQRLCAVKEMINLATDPRVHELAVKSFEREASILATLNHPAIPDVYDFFSEQNRSYLVMEFIQGHDLEALTNEQDQKFPQDSVFDWMIQVCEVLAHLHQHKPQPVIFRDLKPSNIMLDPHGRIRLIDFNIAKVFEEGDKGTMIGTEGYSPPEQYRGESSPQGDVYALGATIHHLLTGQDPRMEPPFSFGERPISIQNSTVSTSFEAIINRCLAYNVADRFENGVVLLDALKTLSRPGTGKLTLNEKLVKHTTEPDQSTADGQIDAQDEALNLQNTVVPIWSFKCEDDVRSTVAVSNGNIFVGAYDNNLYCLKADTGKFAWKYPSSDGIASSPNVYEDSVFIGSSDNHLYSLRRQNGRLNWKFKTDGPIYSSPRADFDHVFFGSDDGFLYAVNVSSGRMAWQTKAHSRVRSSPCITDDRIYFGTEGGYVFSVNLSGEVKWQFQAKRSVTSTPVFAEDMVLVGSMDATIYALDSNSGWAIWRYRTRRSIVSSPIVEDGVLYIGSSDGSLYAIDVHSGRKLWEFQSDGQINGAPAVWEGAVYFGSTDGCLYSIDNKRGKLRWKFRTQGMVISSPVIADGIVYFGSTDNSLYALPV